MCGRFTLSTAADILQQLFEIGAGPLPELLPRYNIAPSQPVAIVRLAEGGEARRLALARWGLVPAWAKDPQIGNRLINARAETVAEKPGFRAAFAARRCLLPADGFYEWSADGGVKQPYLFRHRDGLCLGLAGLWERWRSPDGDELDTCTILTTEANAVVRRVHGRMPVIVPPEAYGQWLDPSRRRRAEVEALLRPGPDDLLVGHRVSRRVNSPANDDAELLQPVD